MTHEKYEDLLSPYHSREWIKKKLYETEMRNLRLFGYGVKGFMLSMIETAVQLTEGRISGREIQVIMDYGKQMLEAYGRAEKQREPLLVNLYRRLILEEHVGRLLLK